MSITTGHQGRQLHVKFDVIYATNDTQQSCQKFIQGKSATRDVVAHEQNQREFRSDRRTTNLSSVFNVFGRSATSWHGRTMPWPILDGKFIKIAIRQDSSDQGFRRRLHWSRQANSTSFISATPNYPAPVVLRIRRLHNQRLAYSNIKDEVILFRKQYQRFQVLQNTNNEARIYDSGKSGSTCAKLTVANMCPYVSLNGFCSKSILHGDAAWFGRPAFKDLWSCNRTSSLYSKVAGREKG